MEHESIQELIVRRAMQEYPMSKSVFWVHLLSFLISSVGGALFLLDAPLFLVLWVFVFFTGVLSLWWIQKTNSIYEKYLFFVSHYGIAILADLVVLIYSCVHPSFDLIVLIAFWVRRLSRFTIFGGSIYKKWGEISTQNDLYYYRDIEKEIDEIATGFVSAKKYISRLIIQGAWIALLVITALFDKLTPIWGLLCCTRCIQTLRTADIPIICYWMRCIKKQEKGSSDTEQ